MKEALTNPSVVKEIEEALSRGSTVELKKERENLVVVEIKRKVKIKTITNG